MRESIELGLRALAQGPPPERVLLAPGDSPGITSELVAQLLQRAAQSPASIVVPVYNGSRGHPVILPWDLVAEIHELPSNLGVNAVLRGHRDRTVELPVSNPDLVADLDTPADLDRLNQGRRAPVRALNEPRMPHVSGTSRSPDRIRVRVRLFALAKERAGSSEIELELMGSARVADLRAALCERVPALRPVLASALIAVDEEYATDDAPIAPGIVVAVIPPVSGGSRPLGQGERNRSS
jgi:molybdopterin converting factor subunit 1